MLDVSKALKYPGQTYSFEISPELEEMNVLGDPVSFEGIRASGAFVGTGSKVGIKGEVTTHVHSRCAKCLEPVENELRAELDAVFARQIDPEDPDLYIFAGSSADLTDAVRDALLLGLPYRYLCSETCKGLCPQCGRNLNLEACTCQEGSELTNPFSALKAIVQNDEEV